MLGYDVLHHSKIFHYSADLAKGLHGIILCNKISHNLDLRAYKMQATHYFCFNIYKELLNERMEEEVYVCRSQTSNKGCEIIR